MPCRGCDNLQCNCFTGNSESTETVGNGSQYAPFTFRPNYIPSPRPFGHMWGLTDQSLDGAPYSLFETTTPDIDQGGNMNAGNRTRLVVPADGVYLVGFTASFQAVNVDSIDNFSVRRNSSVPLSTGTFVHNTSIANGSLMFMTSTTLVNLIEGDTLDLYVERVVGAGTVTVDFTDGGGFSTAVGPHLWAVWMGGPIE